MDTMLGIWMYVGQTKQFSTFDQDTAYLDLLKKSDVHGSRRHHTSNGKQVAAQY